VDASVISRAELARLLATTDEDAARLRRSPLEGNGRRNSSVWAVLVSNLDTLDALDVFAVYAC
jgi:hypothetical protein